jgi:hypothetical protein
MYYLKEYATTICITDNVDGWWDNPHVIIGTTQYGGKEKNAEGWEREIRNPIPGAREFADRVLALLNADEPAEVKPLVAVE